MNRLRNTITHRERGAALLIVLAFVVLLTGLGVAYLSRTTSDRQVAHGSYNQSKADQLVASAMDNIVGDLRKEIANGSTATAEPDGTTLYTPTVAANMIPRRSGNAAIAPNLIRRSVRDDSIIAPGLPSKASRVNSTTDASANGRSVTLARWNTHYLLPKSNTGNDDTYPPSPLLPPFNPYPAVPSGFTPPDWVFITSDPANTDAGRRIIGNPDPLVIGRYAYAIYDEGGLLDMNVAGYPTDPSAAPIPAQRVGRKGSVAFADLRHFCPTTDCTAQDFGIPNPNTTGAAVYQVDRLVGWRNYATTRASNNFPDVTPASQAFARNFQTSTAPATNFYNYVVNNPTGFLSPCAWDSSLLLCSTAVNWNGRTDQSFVQRQELVAFRNTSSSGLSDNQKFPSNALQYLSTFSRETNAPSFSPTTPTVTNPNLLTIRVPAAFTRFDGTTAVVGEPLVKTRFPLSRLAWITYKGPSAVVYAANPSDPVILALTTAGVSLTTIKAGTAANIKTCFGLVWDSRAYVPATATTNSQGQQWVYISPTSANTGGDFDPVTNPGGNPASDIKTLATVASENREPDFFELLRATILDGSLGQNTGGGVTSSATDAQGANTFPDLHMSNKALHVLSIGACILDQTDPDSVPTRIQVKPSAASVWWTAYGVESLPYITQIYPITGTSPALNNKWATYLLFQLWNPHIGAVVSPPAPQVRVRADGNIGVFTGGNGERWSTVPSTQKLTFSLPANGVSMPLTTGAFPQTLPTPTPAPLSIPPIAAAAPAVGSAVAPAGFEILPPKLGNGGTNIQQYIGLRLLPDYPLTSRGSGFVPQLVLYLGTDPTHEFNATMEYDAGGGIWVPYNHFIGIIDRNSIMTINGVTVQGSWINGSTVPVHNSRDLSGTPDASSSNSNPDQFNGARLTDSNQGDCLMKSDPRASRFGVFQFSRTAAPTAPRLTDSLWPTGSVALPNGYGGTISDSAGPIEHAPKRFLSPPSGSGNGIYFPATLCINNAASTSTRTSYKDDGVVIRPADTAYTEAPATGSSTGSATPYYATTTAGSSDYHPIILNRPFRNVAELGYAFRDLPWKTLDFFTDQSGDAGLLDVFTINDGPIQLDGNNNFLSLGPVPTMVAGQVNLNSTQAPDLQSALAGAILDELNPTNTGMISGTGTSATSAPVLATNMVSATSTTPMQNRSELITRTSLPTSILPLPSGAVHDQRVKSRREVVARAMASLSQTRVWNLLIDVVAQSGHYKPNAANLQNDFIVEGEQHYWVHVAIDRFTGQVIDKQIEVVNE